MIGLGNTADVLITFLNYKLKFTPSEHSLHEQEAQLIITTIVFSFSIPLTFAGYSVETNKISHHVNCLDLSRDLFLIAFKSH